MKQLVGLLDKEKMVDGVCGGIAEYFGIDPTLVRLVFGADCGERDLCGAVCWDESPVRKEEGMERLNCT